ncbi:Protein of unknown function [Mesobacillus persicus]|uniref:DUF3939 domain-containing protein n=1 Tax=Mesobacillus persicus TaxID=930146 RepID=A0A1H8DUJ3_9BACI|nr:DUF3939 domain-containing protein [Mesobacillus persicus]SEN10816.1 Protein of unknown function [Mesobacillus persicus]
MEQLLGVYPASTVIGVLLALVIVGVISFLILYKDKPSPNVKKSGKKDNAEWPIIDVTLEEVIKAVRSFSEGLPKGVYRTILVKDDFSIDFNQLTSILHGIPSKPFYMSKETYDIFEEREKDIPPIIDRVQKAVDQYVKDQNKYPMLPYDPLRRVNYYLLIQEHYLDTMPEVELYITDYDGLISHHKPKKKQAGD